MICKALGGGGGVILTSEIISNPTQNPSCILRMLHGIARYSVICLKMVSDLCIGWTGQNGCSVCDSSALRPQTMQALRL